MLKLIGVVKVLDPEGFSVKLMPRTPLLTGLPVAKVCLRRVCALPEESEPPELEPQAASAMAATTAPRSSPRRNHGDPDVFQVCMQHPPQSWQGPGRECSIGSVRRSLFVLLVVLLFPTSAAAAPVLVLGHNGHATLRNDPYVTGPAVTPAPRQPRPRRSRPPSVPLAPPPESDPPTPPRRARRAARPSRPRRRSASPPSPRSRSSQSSPGSTGPARCRRRPTRPTSAPTTTRWPRRRSCAERGRPSSPR